MTGFLNTIILLGTIQGLIVSTLLFRRTVNKRSNRLLAFLILLMSMACLNLYCVHSNLLETSRILRIISWFVPMIVIMPMGPLIYFYIQSMLNPSFRLTRNHRLQFLAGIIDIVPQVTTIIFLTGVYMKVIKYNPEPWGLFIDRYNMYSDIPRWLSLTVYVLLSFRFLRKEKTAGVHTDKEAVRKWLQLFINIFIAFQFIWFIYLIPYIHPAYSDRLLNKFDWYPIYIPIAIMIYWLGLKGYFISLAINTEKVKKTLYRDITKEGGEQIMSLLQKSMKEDKLYLNPELNLEAVAKHTGIVAKMISTVLNQHQQTNFNEWVNAYRIGEFKGRLRSGSLEQLTIAALAVECGFNSQATFQRIFKQSEGVTPSAYLKTIGSDN
ncbi:MULTISPECIES: helix-turn-helix domain-containing protein [Niastella]|uniref:Helix-turn-helix transcriptional regulator n=1 Tax=Niastella soli TaxID=2821487 RepID=A0ABS3YWE6_9BACT|nr:helix-turn-helix transcriptional regulator [Niastella soli]MBO9202149.1 helix-turn-helix transcriptional regulator [Niastella soli]